MSAEIGKWPSAEILARLDREGVPCAPVLNRYQVIEDAQVRENDLIEVLEDPLFGKVRQPRPAARFGATPAAIRSLAPTLGADNAAILSELGYNKDEIAALTARQVLYEETAVNR
jgi:crotonobetainyl-CoA:carnitine CoA-transferase CaiB-like acyl-CoA transferase